MSDAIEDLLVVPYSVMFDKTIVGIKNLLKVFLKIFALCKSSMIIKGFFLELFDGSLHPFTKMSF